MAHLLYTLPIMLIIPIAVIGYCLQEQNRPYWVDAMVLSLVPLLNVAVMVDIITNLIGKLK